MRRFVTPFILLCFVGLVARLGYQLARSPVLPEFARSLGAGPELIGLTVGASTVTGVFIKLPAGALSDILGRRRMLLLGALFFALPPFVYPVLANVYALLALRFVHGFATAIFSPVASAAVADLFAAGRGERLGWFASASEVGSALAPLAGGFLLTWSNNNFALVYLIVGMLGVVPLLLVAGLPLGKADNPPSRTFQQGERWSLFRKGMGQVVRNRSLLIASSAEGAMFLGVGALSGFLPLYATRQAALSVSQVGVILAGQLATAMVAKPLTGRLSDELGRKPLILSGLVLCAVVLPVVALTTSFPLLILEGVAFGLGMAIVTPSTTALVTDLSKAGGYGAALGVFGSIWDVGEAAGPILAGALIGAFAAAGNAYLPTFVIIGALMAAAALLFSALVKDVIPTAPGSVG